MKKIGLSSVFMVYIFVSANVYAQQLAFPTAEGHGKYAQGGRGGVVVEVTNLNDSGPGSLRDALENQSGPRTIVFRVGGIIDLQSQLTLEDDAYVTIAGQTAPGGGICIRNFPLMIEDCEHIVVRYLRSRLGDLGTGEDDALSVRSSKHVILDHCSLGWSIDSILDITHGSGDVTVQYCILSEALVNSRHQKGSHGYAAGWDGVGGSSYHHNLIAHCVSRTPRLDKYLNEDGSKDLIEVVNNVIYNWTSYGAYGGEEADVNWINNFYRFGPETSDDRKDWIFGAGSNIQMYVDGNFVYGYPDVTADNSLGINYDGKSLEEIRADVLVGQPFDTEGINAESAEEAYKTVLSNAGALLPARDAVDIRIIEDVINGTGSFIDSQDEVGGWPEYAAGTAPADTDHDGMPDDWEDENELDKNDAADRNGDLDGDGYTNLEEYLNSLVVFADTGTIDLPPVPASSVEVSIEGDLDLDSIPVNHAPVQFIATVWPEDAANKAVTWSVNGGDRASIDPATGLLTPLSPGLVYVRATAADGSGASGLIPVTIVDVVLSIDAANDGTISVYPNPVSKHVKIKTPGELKMIQLMDVTGGKIGEYSAREINLEGLKNGVYFLKIFVGNTSEMIRIIKI